MKVKILDPTYKGSTGSIIYVDTDNAFPIYKIKLDSGEEVFMFHEDLEFIKGCNL